ncbi:MAG TPA: extracellular solute-binding protein [Calidithermus sp.]|nr:extracellular solute-binding protein [Calidithermus sp.]
MDASRTRVTRRRFLTTGAAAAVLAGPAVARPQTATLKITTWGGKWGEVMKGWALPAFEQEFRCRVEVDSAFPFVPKLQASPRSKPIYDVLHTNSNEQWALAVKGLVEPRVDPKKVPNLADVYPYAVSDKIVGVSIFTSAIGLGFRTDKNVTPPTSWKELWDPKYAGVRAAYVIPINSLGQALFMMAGQVFGAGLRDLDASFRAMENLRPVKLVDFTGTMEKLLLAGEAHIGVIHDSGILRYEGQNQPIEWAAPREGVMALEQVLSLTPGSPVKELGHAYIDFMLRPDVQKRLAEAVWYSPSNRKVKLDPKYEARLFIGDRVRQLIQLDWKWYNERKDEIDARVNRIFRA